MEKDYVPFGEDWKKEVMKNTKSDIVDMLGNGPFGLREQSERTESLEHEFRKLVIKCEELDIEGLDNNLHDALNCINNFSL